MTEPRRQWAGPHQDVLHLVLCVLAIVVGVLMYVNAFHVGADHKGLGVIEATIGILLLV
jgi:hypothetical protein